MKSENNPDQDDPELNRVPQLLGVVLIGGLSTRMGQDKSTIDYHGQSQRQVLFELLSSICVRALLSCNARQAMNLSTLPYVVDQFPEKGPIGGILSVFQAYPKEALLTVPCDLPRLERQTLIHLITRRNPEKLATTLWNHQRQSIEPLLTIWEPAICPVLESYVRRGILSPYRILTEENVEIVPAPDSSILENVNDYEHSEAAKLVLKKSSNSLPEN